MLDLAVIAWIGILLFVLGTSLSTVGAVADGGPLRLSLRSYIRQLERQTKALFLPISPAQIPALQALGLVVGVVGGALYEPYVYLVAPGALVAPRIYFAVLAHKRRRQIEEQTVGWLTALTNSLKVTGSLVDAFQQTLALTEGPLAQELDLMLKECRMGLPVQDALRGMAERIRSEVFSTVVTVIMIGRGTGGELPAVLAQTAASLRERFRLEGVLRKHTANAKTQLIVLLATPFGILVMFNKLQGNFFEPLFTNGILGYLIIGVAFLVWLAAGHMGRKILAVDM